MFEAFGVLGSILLGASALPQAIESYRSKNSDGLALGFIAMWWTGMVSMTIYIVPKGDIILTANYVVNLFLVTIIARYKLWPIR
jgi:uncharacterized protein with PQ loop repeat